MGRLFFALASAIVIACFSPPASSAGQRAITIGVTNWAENIAVANLWRILLTERGYEVELRTGVARGDIDLSLETWLPDTDKAVIDRFGRTIEVHDSWYKGTGLGLVVPAYVPVNTLGELSEWETEFPAAGKAAAIVGIDPGASLMQMTEEAIRVYGLDMTLVNSSEAGMMSALARAYRDRAPIVVTLWNPHWAFAEYDLKYLRDPEKVFGDGDDIHFMSRVGFGSDHPEVLGWLNAWDMGDRELGSLMASIEKAGDAEAGTRQWLAGHRVLADSWLVTREIIDQPRQ